MAPIPRLAIVLGRTSGGTTNASFQALLLLGASLFLGIKVPSLPNLLLALVFMALIGISFTSLGISMASRMEDPHGFHLIFNFLIMPTFFLSGALFPLEDLPNFLKWAAWINPLTYGVDGLRGALLGQSEMGVALDLFVLCGVSSVLLTLGAVLFRGARM